MGRHVAKPQKIFTKLQLSVFFIIALLGLMFVFYPYAATYRNDLLMAGKVKSYSSSIKSAEFEEKFNKAIEYNKNLKQKSINGLTPLNQLPDEYKKLLDFSGIMSRITVPSLNIDIPVYHGSGDDVLTQGAGHVYGTSLPTGGVNTNSLITAHSGMASARMFDDLNKIKKGDRFIVTTGIKTMYYKVIDTRVVSPDEAKDVAFIKPGKDLVTLVTCTPYSVNTHRFIAVGERLNIPETDVKPEHVHNAASLAWLYWCVGSLILLCIITYLLSRKSVHR